VDPFSGEGIGNAMASAESAFDTILEHKASGRFSASELSGYDARIKRRMGQELHISAVMQKMARFPWLINLVIRKTANNEELRRLFSSMYRNENVKEKLAKPGFYLGLLFR
jgi:menaquinone-9 beta-reductase